MSPRTGLARFGIEEEFFLLDPRTLDIARDVPWACPMLAAQFWVAR